MTATITTFQGQQDIGRAAPLTSNITSDHPAPASPPLPPPRRPPNPPRGGGRPPQPPRHQRLLQRLVYAAAALAGVLALLGIERARK